MTARNDGGWYRQYDAGWYRQRLDVLKHNTAQLVARWDQAGPVTGGEYAKILAGEAKRLVTDAVLPSSLRKEAELARAAVALVLATAMGPWGDHALRYEQASLAAEIAQRHGDLEILKHAQSLQSLALLGLKFVDGALIVAREAEKDAGGSAAGVGLCLDDLTCCAVGGNADGVRETDIRAIRLYNALPSERRGDNPGFSREQYSIVRRDTRIALGYAYVGLAREALPRIHDAFAALENADTGTGYLGTMLMLARARAFVDLDRYDAAHASAAKAVALAAPTPYDEVRRRVADLADRTGQGIFTDLVERTASWVPPVPPVTTPTEPTTTITT